MKQLQALPQGHTQPTKITEYRYCLHIQRKKIMNLTDPSFLDRAVKSMERFESIHPFTPIRRMTEEEISYYKWLRWLRG